MNFLVDTHLLLWASITPHKLSAKARALLEEGKNTLWFSAVSILEVAIKQSLKRSEFRIDPRPLRAGLFQMGYTELPLEGRQALDLVDMPYFHTDPFDRLLVAQARSEGMLLLTADKQLAAYGDFVELV
jgi:PIN domain nuclease of toxin-antitoxin system